MRTRFVEITVTNCTDVVTGRMIPVCYGLDGAGHVWRKYADQPWYCVTKDDADWGIYDDRSET